MDDKSQSELNDEIALRVWNDDETVQAKILLSYASSIERAISHAFGRLAAADVEDVVAEAVKRFWKWRHKFDGKRSVRACLYRIAYRVACELTGGRLNWQKTRCRERLIDPDQLDGHYGFGSAQVDAVEKTCPKVHAELNEVIERLPDVQRDIILAYGHSNSKKIDAGDLGRELGKKYKDGVPIPAGTVRQYKMRAKETIVREMRTRGYDLAKLGVVK